MTLPTELEAALRDHFARAAAVGPTGGPSAATLAGLAEARKTQPQTNSPSPPPWQDVSEGPRVPLSAIRAIDSGAFAALLARRRSQREWAPPTLADIATVLVRCCRVIEWTSGPDDYVMTRRPVPSAGARHPLDVHMLAGNVDGLSPGCWRFDALHCELVRTTLEHESVLTVIGEVLGGEPPPAALIAVAYLPRTLSRYPTGLSLLWRDAGALLATLHLCATDAGLASCIAGTCGVLVDEQAAGVLDVGSLALGAQPSR